MAKTIDKLKGTGTIHLPQISGIADLLVVGEGTAVLHRSLDKGESFYPLTDSFGSIIELESVDESRVMLNAQIENDNPLARYQIVTEGEVEVTVVQ
jgi:hypothetical protein